MRTRKKNISIVSFFFFLGYKRSQDKDISQLMKHRQTTNKTFKLIPVYLGI